MNDELVKRLRDRGGRWPIAAADRIEALTREHSKTIDEWRCAILRVNSLTKENVTLEKERDALTADNARLRGAMTGIKRAAAHRMKNDPKDLHSYYFHTADAALNTGKEVMPNDARSSRPAHDIGPGDQGKVAGAVTPVGMLMGFLADPGPDWCLMDGRHLPEDQYPELARVMTGWCRDGAIMLPDVSAYDVLPARHYVRVRT